MNKVNTLDEAREWFSSNASGNVICAKDGQEKVCASFPEAESFYHELYANLSTPVDAPSSDDESRRKEDSESDDYSSSSALLGLAISEMSQSFDTPSPDTSSSFDSGGGDFGGGGGGSDF